MQLKLIKQGEVLTAKLSGELDQHSADRVREALETALDDEYVKRLVFDMEGVGFMDSAGIGVILGRYRRLSARCGSMNVVNARKNVERILRMSGVYKLCTERSGK